MKAFKIDEKSLDSYLKRSNTRKTLVFFGIVLLCFSAQGFIAYHLDAHFPFWIFSILLFIVAIAFYFSLKLGNDKLKQLANGSFELSDSTLSFLSSGGERKEFKFSEIAIIHRQFSGTTLVRGTSWTKLNYFLPKRTSSYQIGAINVIFIPTITVNYKALIDAMKDASKHAIQI
jgi:hypothetical protein